MLVLTDSSLKGSIAMKKALRYVVPGLLLLLPVCAQAQSGCIHSPECPTAVLGAVGAAGAAVYARWRSR